MSTTVTETRKVKRGAPMPEDLRRQLKTVTEVYGVLGVMRQTGLSRGAVERALAGFAVYKGTVSVIREWLAGRVTS